MYNCCYCYVSDSWINILKWISLNANSINCIVPMLIIKSTSENELSKYVNPFLCIT